MAAPKPRPFYDPVVAAGDMHIHNKADLAHSNIIHVGGWALATSVQSTKVNKVVSDDNQNERTYSALQNQIFKEKFANNTLEKKVGAKTLMDSYKKVQEFANSNRSA